jgi:hypothetical protein
VLSEVAAELMTSLELKRELLQYAKQTLLDSEAEAQLAALLTKYVDEQDDFSRLEAAAGDAEPSDKPLVLAKIKVSECNHLVESALSVGVALTCRLRCNGSLRKRSHSC